MCVRINAGGGYGWIYGRLVEVLTVKGNDTENETQTQNQDDDRVDLQPRALIRIELCSTQYG